MAISIKTQPSSCAIPTGKSALFSVVVDGEVASYQWQWMATKTATEWKNSSVASGKTANLKFTTTAALDGYMYRCEITGADGTVIYSDVVEMIVIDARNQRGLVSMSMMSDIADAIREKTETSDYILPEVMAAMIRGIDVGKIMTGYVSGNNGLTPISLGVSLPVYDNYSFIIMPINETHYAGIKMVMGVITCDFCFTPSGTVTSNWSIDFEAGTVVNSKFTPPNDSQYKWWYFEEKI